MAIDFSAFAENIDEKGLEELKAKYNPEQEGSFAPIPSGVYPVSLDKMELTRSTWGTDQINITFKIVDGERKNALIFYNGTLDTHFAHGYSQTARLISELTDGGLDEGSILFNIIKDTSHVKEYLLDLYQLIVGKFEYDLSYEVKISNKTNPNTGKPYENKFFSIKEVFDV